jgi:hypothetical protein
MRKYDNFHLTNTARQDDFSDVGHLSSFLHDHWSPPLIPLLNTSKCKLCKSMAPFFWYTLHCMTISRTWVIYLAIYICHWFPPPPSSPYQHQQVQFMRKYGTFLLKYTARQDDFTDTGHLISFYMILDPPPPLLTPLINTNKCKLCKVWHFFSNTYCTAWLFLLHGSSI